MTDKPSHAYTAMLEIPTTGEVGDHAALHGQLTPHLDAIKKIAVERKGTLTTAIKRKVERAPKAATGPRAVA